MEDLKNTNEEQNAGKLNIIVNDKSFEWPDQYILGSQVKELVEIVGDAKVYLAIKGPYEDEHIKDYEKVDLARPGIERFYTKDVLGLTINGKPFEWERQYIFGNEIRMLGNVSMDEELFLSIAKPYKDELIKDDEKVDLARPGIEYFFSKSREPEKVTIFIDDIPREVLPGDHSVADLKKIGHVSAGFELDQEISKELVPLKDDAIICIKGGERFKSHVRDGKSS